MLHSDTEEEVGQRCGQASITLYNSSSYSKGCRVDRTEPSDYRGGLDFRKKLQLYGRKAYMQGTWGEGIINLQGVTPASRG